MKNKVTFIHKEPTENCFEILKSVIVEDQELKKYRIDKNTLIQNLPEEVVNKFLDFLGTDEDFRDFVLYMIKTGKLIIECKEEE